MKLISDYYLTSIGFTVLAITTSIFFATSIQAPGEKKINQKCSNCCNIPTTMSLCHALTDLSYQQGHRVTTNELNEKINQDHLEAELTIEHNRRIPVVFFSPHFILDSESPPKPQFSFDLLINKFRLTLDIATVTCIEIIGKSKDSLDVKVENFPYISTKELSETTEIDIQELLKTFSKSYTGKILLKNNNKDVKLAGFAKSSPKSKLVKSSMYLKDLPIRTKLKLFHIPWWLTAEMKDYTAKCVRVLPTGVPKHPTDY